MKIANYDDLIRHGHTRSRKIVLDVANEALAQVDAYETITSLVRVDGRTLIIGNRRWSLDRKRNVYLLGAGKACNAMAMAVDHALGDQLTQGMVIVKIAEPSDFYHRTEAFVGGHPIPNRDGYLATAKILELVDSAGPDDLFIVVISGGSSALMNAPIAPITMEDEAEATRVLLTSGLSIYEINAVRRHISHTNGGRLAERIAKTGAELVGIAISDAVGKPPRTDISEPDPSYVSTLIGADFTTLDDARRAIRDHGLEGRLPVSVVNFFAHAGDADETPKEFANNTYFLINSLPDLANAAVRVAASRGIRAHVLSTFMEGESCHAGTFLAAVGREVQTNGRPVSAPCLLISSGETTTQLDMRQRPRGHGGPSQEMAVAFALAAQAIPGACLMAIDSEGTDGTSRAAGGLTDSTSARRAESLGLDLRGSLRGHATFEALSALGDSVVTGNTGTNLCDLNLLYVPALDGGVS